MVVKKLPPEDRERAAVGISHSHTRQSVLTSAVDNLARDTRRDQEEGVRSSRARAAHANAHALAYARALARSLPDQRSMLAQSSRAQAHAGTRTYPGPG